MLQRGCLPDVDLVRSTGYNPLAHYYESADLLDATLRQLQLGDLLAALVHPDTPRGGIARTTRPGGKDDLLPCQCRGDFFWGLRAGDEDEVQPALEVVRLQGAADGCGDLEGGFAERERCEGDTGRRNEADGLMSCQQSGHMTVNVHKHTRKGAKILDWRTTADELFSPSTCIFWRLVMGPPALAACTFGLAMLIAARVNQRRVGAGACPAGNSC